MVQEMTHLIIYVTVGMCVCGPVSTRDSRGQLCNFHSSTITNSREQSMVCCHHLAPPLLLYRCNRLLKMCWTLPHYGEQTGDNQKLYSSLFVVFEKKSCLDQAVKKQEQTHKTQSVLTPPTIRSQKSCRNHQKSTEILRLTALILSSCNTSLEY